ncbi:MAG: DUF805 domain-containing protein [Lentisphaerae bacterium]|nr:DUF805 domain-containing protein [Lentisphaerota bacterium]
MKLHWDFEGRISRKEYLFGFVFLVLVYTGSSLLFVLLFSLPTGNPAATMGFFVIVFKALFIWPNFCLQTKRFHDLNLSGWWCLVNVIPYIGPFITLFTLGLLKGEQGENRFGVTPLSDRPIADRAYQHQY